MFEREGLAGFDGDSQRVQHGVGAAAHGDIEGECVFKGFAGEDVAWPNVLGDQIDDAFTGFFKQLIACRVGGENASVTGEREAQRFVQAVHAIGGEHAGA